MLHSTFGNRFLQCLGCIAEPGIPVSGLLKEVIAICTYLTDTLNDLRSILTPKSWRQAKSNDLEDLAVLNGCRKADQ